MANDEHVKILREDIAEWNNWRQAHPNVTPDLCGASLVSANLPSTFLNGTDLRSADLRSADLNGANLYSANLHRASLSRTNLSSANLSYADLSYADLNGANLRSANLRGANLRGANLLNTDFHSANLLETAFVNTHLSQARDLEACNHRGPSTLDHRTHSRSGPLPLDFLHGCGLSDWEIEAAKLYQTSLSQQDIIDITYRIADLKTQNPIGYQSCFISYTDSDKACAKKLHAALQDNGVRCWFAPEDLKIGHQLINRIDEAIHSHRKLLLLLSEASLASRWVEREVRTALRRELNEDGGVLFPIRLDDAIMESGIRWAAEIRETRHIGDFRNWRRDEGFQTGFDRLLRDIRGEPSGPD